ncbi:CpaD family pilus assembly protein [Rhizobium sp. L1K21]|uniref:CpaD family pilus assembly protein n=1 Tax=Rhizobium sp. L1K21 TaxID=2954933 RepID=UPI002093B40D|nr:CpaD family pilus assembly protein [Rhizobium sp. L1K21]MCO6187266.1 CpaD family pilus assembly protein [Rhizobium sp. L1K21]
MKTVSEIEMVGQKSGNEMTRAKKMRFVRNAVLVALVSVVAAPMAGCAKKPDDSLKTASIDNDYRVRHPITLAEVEHSLDLPIGSGDRKLSNGLRDTIRGFGQDYANSSSGSIQLSIPAGSINSAAAQALTGAIKAELYNSGVKKGRIIVTTYPAQGGEVSAPVKLSFIAVSATTDQCGQWPEDLINNSFSNKNWYNFGCANQNNLAAMVANPMDLKTPRAETPIDAERRATVIGLYREGSSPVSE